MECIHIYEPAVLILPDNSIYPYLFLLALIPSLLSQAAPHCRQIVHDMASSFSVVPLNELEETNKVYSPEPLNTESKEPEKSKESKEPEKPKEKKLNPFDVKMWITTSEPEALQDACYGIICARARLKDSNHKSEQTENTSQSTSPHLSPSSSTEQIPLSSITPITASNLNDEDACLLVEFDWERLVRSVMESIADTSCITLPHFEDAFAGMMILLYQGIGFVTQTNNADTYFSVFQLYSFLIMASSQVET